MSVFTVVTREQLSAWLKKYSIGTLLDLEGIPAGIENTNYLVRTTEGPFVLTLFEKLKARELSFYLELMAHLSRCAIPCPSPLARLDDGYLGVLNGKPATLVSYLPGKDVKHPTPEQCAKVGVVLAEMHVAARTYRRRMANPRGPKWWNAAMPEIVPFMGEEDVAMLREELRFQSQHRSPELPRGVVHADLFRDNVLFEDDRLSGVIDFYFACTDVLLYDVAIAVNDWAVDAGGKLDRERSSALLTAYNRVRPFTSAECESWPVMLRAAALRFWVSRLYDLHLPRPGQLTHAKDPGQFRHILRQHIGCIYDLAQLASGVAYN